MSRHVLNALIVATLCVGGSSSAFAGHAAAAPSGLSVDTEELGDQGATLGPAITRKVLPMLREHGVQPQDVRIRVVWLDADNFHYAIRVTLDPRTPSDQIPIRATCKGCSSTKLVASVARGVRKALKRAEVDRRRADDEAATASKTETGTKASADTSTHGRDVSANAERTPPAPKPKPKRKGLGPLGWAGVGSLGLGLGGVATGAVLAFAIGETHPGANKSSLRNFKPGGYAALGAGGAVLITGAVLLGIDRSRAGRTKTTKRAALSPAWFGQAGGVVVVGRF